MIFGMPHCLGNCAGASEFPAELIRFIKVRFTPYKEDKKACLAMFLDPRFKCTIFKAEKENYYG